MTDTAKTKTGSCLCGAVQFEVDAPLRQVTGCHCTMCRKQTGHFLAFTSVWPENFRLTEERGLKWYRSSEGLQRGFCTECGSVLLFKPDSGERVSISAGALDGDTGLALVAHIYADDKGDYYGLEPDLPASPDNSGVAPMPVKGA